jgi:serine/threonine protein kinase
VTAPAFGLTALMPGRSLGPYVVQGPVGYGAMGVVYHAKHSISGGSVAIKSVRLQSPDLVASFRREAHALKQLDHPGIVKLLDDGLADETPWYAMELVPGRPLSLCLPRLAGAEDVPLNVPSAQPWRPLSPPERGRLALPRTDLLRIVRKICDALTFMHERGMVHRDLKPDNILIRPNGEPVIADFGLVAKFAGIEGREVLDMAMPRAGTLAYMAPEQRLDHFVDARADLFSLGCLLYEILTGELPFGAGGIGRNGPHSPPRPSARAGALGAVPESLDRLTSRLLARDPAARIGYADDVAKALDAFVVGASADPTRPSTYLYRAELIARSDLLLRVSKLQEHAGAGRGATVLISGESGIGKTRMLMEIASRAADLAIPVIAGDCSPVSASMGERATPCAPLQPFRELLLSIVDAHRGADAGSLLLDRFGPVLAPYEPALGDCVASVALAPPEALPPQPARARVVSTLRTLLSEKAASGPLLLCIDDLQWADDLSTDLLISLAKEPCGPIVVVATCRSEEMTPALRRWADGPSVVHERLPHLDRGAVADMVGGMLAMDAVPREVVDDLHRESAGNPFFIAEYLRAAVSGGLLDRDGSGQWMFRSGGGGLKTLSLPGTIAALVERRLADLDGASLATLSAAAVLGRRFDVDLLSITAEVDSAAVLDTYGSLRARQILDEDANGSMRFVHDYLRETMYSRIDRGVLAMLHLRAGRALEQRYAGRELDLHLAALGHHFAQAGLSSNAAGYFERAGEHARRGYANQDALRLYGLAVEQLANGPTDRETSSRLREAMGDLYLLTGDAGAARASFASALDSSAPDGIARACRRRKLARAWERDHRHTEALACYALAEVELGEAPATDSEPTVWWRELVEIQVEKAWDLYFLNETVALAALVGRLRPIVDRYSEPAQRARFFLAAAHAEIRSRRYRVGEESMRYTRSLLESATVAGEIQLLAVARFSHAFLLLFGGEEAAAEPLLCDAIAGAERLGDQGLQARFCSYHALLHRRLGRVEQARAMAERALAHASATQMFDYVGSAEGTLAWAALRDDREADVAVHGARALAAWDSLRSAYVFPFEWLARMPLAAHALRSRDAPKALAQWRFLLDERQQRLPDSLEGAIRAALEAGDGPSANESAAQVLDLAIRLRLL